MKHYEDSVCWLQSIPPERFVASRKQLLGILERIGQLTSSQDGRPPLSLKVLLSRSFLSTMS